MDIWNSSGHGHSRNREQQRTREQQRISGTVADTVGAAGKTPDKVAAMAELAGTAASSSATNPAGILRTAPTEEDEDTVASEDGEVEEHNGGRGRQEAGGRAGGRAEATTGGEGL